MSIYFASLEPKCTDDPSVQTPVPINDASPAYLKTACIVAKPLSQADADAYCKARGMVLFVISDSYIQTSIFDILAQLVGQNPAVFRVDGKRDEPNGDWNNYSYGKQLAFGGLDWLQTYDTLTGSGTMIIENIAYPLMKQILTWKVDGVDPDTPFPFICEFV
jgi:hypothetical protein